MNNRIEKGNILPVEELLILIKGNFPILADTISLLNTRPEMV